MQSASPRVLVTRPQGQNTAFIKALIDLQFSPVIMPLLKIRPFDERQDPQHCQQIAACLSDIESYQHLIFISTNAVDLAMMWLQRQSSQSVLMLSNKLTVYAIGKATAERLQQAGICAQQAGVSMNSESLLTHDSLQSLSEQRVLIFRGSQGRNYLRQQLQSRGAKVDYCELYQRGAIEYPRGELKAHMNKGLDYLTMNSAETIQQLLEQAMIENISNSIKAIPVIVPGQRLAAIAQKNGFKRVIQADNAGLSALMQALNKAV